MRTSTDKAPSAFVRPRRPPPISRPPDPTAGSSGPPRPGHGPESGRPADGLHLFTLAAPNSAGSRDFRALAGALGCWLATSSQVASQFCPRRTSLGVR